jgi:hypothetical protein
VLADIIGSVRRHLDDEIPIAINRAHDLRDSFFAQWQQELHEAMAAPEEASAMV